MIEKLKKYKIQLLLSAFILSISFSAINFLITGVVLYTFYLLGLCCLALLFFINSRYLLFSLILILLIVEFGLKRYSPYKSYIERNGAFSYIAMHFPHPSPEPKISGYIEFDKKLEFNFAHRYNSLGYKDSESQSKRYKALILGDSFVQGVGVDSFHTIDKLLEQKLSCQNCILNMGLSGNELINNFRLLNDIHSKGITASYIILNLNETDINDILFSAKKIPELKFKGPSYLFQYFYGVSFIFRHFVHNTLNYNWNLLSIPEQEKVVPEVLELIYTYVLKYNEYCKKNNAKFILVFQSMHDECRTGNYRLENLYSSIKKEHPEISTINLMDIFAKDCDRYYWPIDLHFNEEAYRLYSKTLFERILEKESNFKQ